MTSPSTPPGMREVRGLGWDIDSTYSANRGDLFSDRIVRSHRVHRHVAVDGSAHEELRDFSVESRPSRREGRRHPLRGKVATVAAAAISTPSDGVATTSTGDSVERTASSLAQAGRRRLGRSHRPTLAGIDVLDAEGFARLRGKRVGLVDEPDRPLAQRRQHHRSARAGARRHARRVVQSRARHPRSGSTTRSRRLATRRRACRFIRSTATLAGRPTRCSTGIDTLVVDLQDIGARFYTYVRRWRT